MCIDQKVYIYAPRVNIYYVKARENRTEFTNSYFGLLCANYEWVASNSQPTVF